MKAGCRPIGPADRMLVGLYLLRILFRFLSNYLAHKAAWHLVGDLRTRTYDKLERMHLGYFHDKQTGDLMSRVVNDTRDFELLYAHMIPESITNLVTFYRCADRAADHQLEAGADHLRADPADLGLRHHLFQKGPPLLPDLPEKDGRAERQAAGQPFRHP